MKISLAVGGWLLAVRASKRNLHVASFFSWNMATTVAACPLREGGGWWLVVGRKGIKKEPAFFIVLQLEHGHHAGVLHVAIGTRLVQLVRAETGAGCRGIRLDGNTFIQQSLPVQYFQAPPEAFNVFVGKGDIGIFQVYPVPHLCGQVVPQVLVTHYCFAAFLVVFRNRDLFPDVFLSDSQFFFHPQFYWESVCIPA